MQNKKETDLFGYALEQYHKGNSQHRFYWVRSDGSIVEQSLKVYFEEIDNFTKLEKMAIEACAGNVLDVGMGTGKHALALQKMGIPVTGIDVSQSAVNVALAQGVVSAAKMDVFEMSFEENLFDIGK